MDQEIKDKIFELWQQGLSGGQIAEEVGVTRNSVMGFIHRMREKGHTMRSERKLKVKVKEPKPPREKKVKQIKEEQIFIEEPLFVEEPAIAEKVYDGPVNIYGLKSYSCRFITEVGNHETTKYCNKRISRNSYCEEHYSLCYFPARMREKSILDRVK